MKQVLLIQGGGKGTHEGWDTKILESLERGPNSPFEHVRLYAKAIPRAVVRRLSGRDHQLNNDMSEVGADIRRLGAVRVSPERPVPKQGRRRTP